MRIKKTVTVIILFFISSLKFFPTIFQGKVALPFDLLIGAYYPWLNQNFGFITGVPVKNNLLSDVISQLYPWILLAKNQILNGQLPLWNPTSIFGYPYFANYHSSIFYPTNILLLLGNTALMHTIQLWLQILMGIYFMHLYLKSLGLSFISTIFGSTAFIFSGLMVTDFEFASGSKAIIWLPLCLYFYGRLGTKNYQKSSLIGLAFAFAMLLLSGHFQVSIYTSLIFLFCLVSDTLNKASILKKLLALFSGILLAAPQLLPTIELVFQSIRLNDSYIQEVNYGLLPIKHLITLFIAPDYLGNPSTGNYFGFWNYREAVGYLGITTTIFLILGLSSTVKRKFKIGFLLSLIFVFTIFGVIPYKLHLPLISASAASRLLFLTSFFGAIIAAFGFESFLKAKRKEITTPLWLFIISIVLLISLTALGYITKSPQSHISLRNLIFPSLIFFGTLISFILIRSKPKLQILHLLPILFLTIDLLRFHYKFNTFTSPQFDFPSTKVIDFLKKEPGTIIQTSTQVLPPNTWTPYGINSALGYDPLYPSRNGYYLQAINRNTSTPPPPSRYLDEANNLTSPLWTAAGVRYFITLREHKNDKFFISSPSAILSEGEVEVFQNPNFISSVYIDHKPLLITSESKILEELMKSHTQKALTTTPLSLEYSNNSNTSTPLYVSPSISGEYNFTFQATQSGLLFLPTPRYPGWQAFLDDRIHSIHPVNYLFSGIEVPKGRHHLKLIYRPVSLTIGIMLSLFSSVFLLFSSLLPAILKSKNVKKH